MSEPAVSLAERPLKCRWILNTGMDVAFFVAPPLLIIPLILSASTRWQTEDIFLFVSTFGALGHHAPGLMRAYGDRKLFRRFWLRFTVVPAIALSVFTFYGIDQLPGLMLVLLFWGTWHFLMQTYGFARIYDSKVGVVDTTTCRLDFALCVAWFGAAVLCASNRMNEFLSLALKSGLSFVHQVPFDFIRTVWLVGTVVVTTLFFVNVARKITRGESVNAIKLLFLGSTFIFLWICTVLLKNFLLGIAMFELFHDVQYLAIVWFFNQNRATRDHDAGTFTRFLFRRSGAMVGIYVGLVFAYGFIGFSAERLTSGSVQQTLFGIVAASNLLHFYYDGFIWKVREQETSTALGVNSNTSSTSRPVWSAHILKWLALIAVICVCFLSERSQKLSKLDQAQAIVNLLPLSVDAHNAFARGLINEGQYVEAIQVGRLAEKLDATHYQTHLNLGVALTATGQLETGFAELQRAFEINSRDVFLQFHLAMGYIRRGQPVKALGHLQTAIAMQPDDLAGRYNLGILYLLLNQPTDAINCLRDVLARSPDYPAANKSLGEAYLQLGDSDAAIRYLQKSLRVDEQNSAIHLLMDTAFRQSGQFQAANNSLMTAIQLRLAEGVNNQNSIETTNMADLLVERTKRKNLDAVQLAVECYAAAYQRKKAAAAASLGAKLARSQKQIQLAESLDQLAKHYLNEKDDHLSR
jgi:tetratricopeptide (TPR) repeat protein